MSLSVARLESLSDRFGRVTLLWRSCFAGIAGWRIPLLSCLVGRWNRGPVAGRVGGVWGGLPFMIVCVRQWWPIRRRFVVPVFTRRVGRGATGNAMEMALGRYFPNCAHAIYPFCRRSLLWRAPGGWRQYDARSIISRMEWNLVSDWRKFITPRFTRFIRRTKRWGARQLSLWTPFFFMFIVGAGYSFHYQLFPGRFCRHDCLRERRSGGGNAAARRPEYVSV